MQQEAKLVKLACGEHAVEVFVDESAVATGQTSFGTLQQPTVVLRVAQTPTHIRYNDTRLVRLPSAVPSIAGTETVWAQVRKVHPMYSTLMLFRSKKTKPSGLDRLLTVCFPLRIGERIRVRLLKFEKGRWHVERVKDSPN